MCRSSTFNDVQLAPLQSTTRRSRTIQTVSDSPVHREGSSTVAATMLRSFCSEGRPPSRLPVAAFRETRCSTNGNAPAGKYTLLFRRRIIAVIYAKTRNDSIPMAETICVLLCNFKIVFIMSTLSDPELQFQGHSIV